LQQCAALICRRGLPADHRSHPFQALATKSHKIVNTPTATRRAGYGGLWTRSVAVVGVILNLSIWFALHTIFPEISPMRSFGLSFDMPVWSSLDVAALVLAVATATAVFRFNVDMLTVLAGACVAGVALRLLGII
jgi:hypothetical protein